MKKSLKANKVLFISILILLIWAIYYLKMCYDEGGLVGTDPILLYYHGRVLITIDICSI